MPSLHLIKALAKVMIAAAWSDGKVTTDEVNSLKDLLFRMPGMTAEDWAELDIYLHSPVTEAERDRLVAELQAHLVTPADRELARQALQELVEADGQVPQPEQVALEEIRAALDEVDVSILGRIGRLLTGPMERQRARVSAAPNREQFLEDFVKNRIYYSLQLHLQAGQLQIKLSDVDLRKLSLAGGLLARVAYVDHDVIEAEFETIVTALQQAWKIGREAAGLIAEVAISEIGRDMDYYRLTRQFFEYTNAAEREQFVEALFCVAASDGRATHEEMEEIRTIATVLKLTHAQFIAAKLSIPAEQRAY